MKHGWYILSGNNIDLYCITLVRYDDTVCYSGSIIIFPTAYCCKIGYNEWEKIPYGENRLKDDVKYNGPIDIEEFIGEHFESFL